MKKRVSTIQELYDFLQMHMLTKGEFDEFKRGEFQEELKKLATKEELKKLVTRGEFQEEIKKLATKKEFKKFSNDALTRIDKFIVLHEKLETELTALKSQYNRLETRLEKLEARLAT